MSRENNADFIALRREVRALGFHRKTTAILLGQFALFIAASVIGVALIVNVSNLALKALGMYLVAFSCMGMSTNGHTASHQAISDHAWLDEFVTFFNFPLFLGVSAKYWRHKHIVVHHPHPNVIGLDNDADLSPIFTLNDQKLAQARGLHGWWYRHQGWFFPFVLSFNSYGVAFKGWRFLVQDLLDPERRNRESWIDLGCMIAHWIIWTFIPIALFGFANVAIFFAVQMFIISYIMFALFAPAHYPVEAIQVTSTATRDNYLMLQTATAINFTTGPVGRLLCGGVEFQIEHHLFPWISTPHYPQLAPLVKKFCDDHGYPYRSQSWAKGLWSSWLTLFRPKPIYSEFPAYPPEPEPEAAAEKNIAKLSPV